MTSALFYFFAWHFVQFAASFRAEGLGAVVAGTAELSIIHVLHGDGISTLLHLEDRRMASRALEPFVSMYFAVKDNLIRALRRELHGLSGRDRECGNRHRERYNHDKNKYE